jgi:hypothetical protein
MAATKKSYFPASAKKGLPVSLPRPEKENPQIPPDLKKGAAPPVGKPAKMSGFLGSDTFWTAF